jgi:hypothetical protein
MISSSNVFFVNNPDPDPNKVQKLLLKPDPKKNVGSTILDTTVDARGSI